jgi:hypothetical protein
LEDDILVTETIGKARLNRELEVLNHNFWPCCNVLYCIMLALYNVVGHSAATAISQNTSGEFKKTYWFQVVPGYLKRVEEYLYKTVQ